MRRLLLGLVVCFLASMAQGKSLYFFVDDNQSTILRPASWLRGVSPNEYSQLIENLYAARREALDILEASHKLKPSKMVRRMRQKLKTALFVVPPNGKTFKLCKPNTAAFVINNGKNHIYICNFGLRALDSVTAMAQVLIHEAAHTAGLINECDATSLEVSVMESVGLNIAFEHAHILSCN